MSLRILLYCDLGLHCHHQRNWLQEFVSMNDSRLAAKFFWCVNYWDDFVTYLAT